MSTINGAGPRERRPGAGWWRYRVPIAAGTVLLALGPPHRWAFGAVFVIASIAVIWTGIRISRRPRIAEGLALPSIWRSLRDAAQTERRLLGLLRPYRARVALGLTVTVAITVVGLAKPWPTKILVDDVFGGGSLAGLSADVALGIAAGLTAVLFMVGGVLHLAQTRILYGLTQRLIKDLREQLFAHLTLLSLRFHDERGAADSTFRVSADTYAIHTLLLNGLVPMTSSTLTLVGTFIVMAALDLTLAVLAFVSLPAAAAISYRYGKRLRRSSVRARELESDVYMHAEHTLTGIRAVKSYGREEYESGRFRRHVDGSRAAMLKLMTERTLFGVAVDSVLGIGLALVMWVAARRALDGPLTLGEVLVFLAYAATTYLPISDLANVFGEVQSAAAGAQRVFEVLDEPAPLDDPRAVPPVDPARGHLHFEGVRFGYLADHVVLHGIDLDIPPGRTIALVGPTGAGKSTMIGLLMRLYDVSIGSVTVDGLNVAAVPVRWLREQITYVPQDPVLFPGTVRENIRYGRLDATDAEVEQAARQANILDELSVDPRGLDAPVGDRGITLSGGQRQRVAIARAFLKDAPIILLDEPTAALDAATEALVMDALFRLLPGRTCVIIAHRLATVEHADHVVVLDQGRIVQRGTHRQLLRRRGLYRELHAARFGGSSGRA